MTRVRAIEPVNITCPGCGDVYRWQTVRSWWHSQDRCFRCPNPEPVTELPTVPDLEGDR